MHVSLPSDLESFVREKVESGAFEDANEVICSALEALKLQETLTPDDITELRAALLPAIESLDRGEGVPWDVERVRARLRARLDPAGDGD